eukprot:TRINITY_DN3082_c0_g1_i1.p1 TRINITY_DN3082_c0_g1~~TRINITY_DN3082_c0_g1_i1.p1  ORF type:complete len:305 (-),score=83.01 TRINITY_DN3082_c0_g1_i1:170-1045(-)
MARPMSGPTGSKEGDILGNSLLNAAGEGKLDKVKELISKGANVNWGNGFHLTPLHEAVNYYHQEVLEFLLSRGANPNIHVTPLSGLPTPNESTTGTALHYAAKSGSLQSIQALLAAGAKINEKNYEGETPLHILARNWRKSSEEVGILLVKSGADLKAKHEEKTIIDLLKSSSPELKIPFVSFLADEFLNLGVINWQISFSGQEMKKKDLFSESDPYLVFYGVVSRTKYKDEKPEIKEKKEAKKSKGSSKKWTQVHQTEVITDDRNPNWKDFELSIQSPLCWGSLDQIFFD